MNHPIHYQRPPKNDTSFYAIASLVCGILGWSFLPFLGSVVAIVTGHLALKELSASPGMQGKGLSIAGLILGYMMILSIILMLLFFGGFAAVFAWIVSRG